MNVSGIVEDIPKDKNDKDLTTNSQYAVRWRLNSYLRTVSSALTAMRGEQLFVDVTLSCEGKLIFAHRLLLAACSPYFRTLFYGNASTHPIVIFQNVAYEDLLAVINFIYNGEVSVCKSRLASFLNTALLLQVNGLTDPQSSSDTDQTILKSESSINKETHNIEPKRRKLDIDKNILKVTDDDNEIVPESLILDDDLKLEISSNAEESNLTVDPFNTFNEKINPSEETDICDDDTLQTANILSNLKGETTLETSIDGTSKETIQDGDLVKFRCQLCWKGFKHPTSLTLHKDSHTGKTQCPICQRSFSRSYDMRSHLMKIHHDLSALDSKQKISKATFGNNT